MNYQICGIDPTPFQRYFAMSDAELYKHGAARTIAGESPGYPCRVSLEDAPAGEELVLVSYEHQTANGPYSATGPIYVRRNATETAVFTNEIPRSFQMRLLSVRAYDATDFIVDAEVDEGVRLSQLIERFFADPQVAYLHVHYARRGCFAGRVDRT